MSDESTDEDAAEEAPAEEPPKKSGGLKLVLMIVLPLLLLGGAGAGLFASGLLDGLLGHDSEDEAAALAEAEAALAAGPGFFYELPDMVVNLNSGQRRQNFLKLSVSLELASEEDVPAVERVLPRIVDNFQIYLRELRLEDLRGSVGLYRLREELLRRVSVAAAPAEVRDVLFREMLVQ